MKIKKILIYSLVFVLGAISYPFINMVFESISKDESIFLTGSGANFFKEYVIPLPEDAKLNNNYDVFRAYSDDSKIELGVKLKTFTHDETTNFLELIADKPTVMKESLRKMYCEKRGLEPLMPESALFPFITAREKNTAILISYYDKTGESLLFSFGVGPSSCYNEHYTLSDALSFLPRFDKVEGYNPFDTPRELEGYELFSDRFVYSDSPEETRAIKRKIDAQRSVLGIESSSQFSFLVTACIFLVSILIVLILFFVTRTKKKH